MKKIIFAALVLCSVSTAFAVEDSRQVQVKLSDAYELWESAVERANRDYHRRVLQIRQDQKEELEENRDRMAKAKRYSEIAEYTQRIERVDQEIELTRDAIKDNASPGEPPADPKDDRIQGGDADWYKGEWIFTRLKDPSAPRTIRSNGTALGARGFVGQVKQATPDLLVIDWGDVEERWFKHADGTILVVETKSDVDGLYRMGILNRK